MAGMEATAVPKAAIYSSRILLTVGSSSPNTLEVEAGSS